MSVSEDHAQRCRLVAAEGVIFDIDGTLIDTREAHLQAWEEALASYGHQVPREKLEALFGQHSSRWPPALLPPRVVARIADELIRRKDEIFAARLPSMLPFPGARELLADLHAAGKRLALATGATWHEMQIHLDILDARPFIEVAVYDTEVKRGKPDPETYRLAMQRLGTDPALTVAVGDSIYDVQSALGAGVGSVICVQTGGFTPQTLTAAGACEVYPDVASLRRTFLADLAASPSPLG